MCNNEGLFFGKKINESDDQPLTISNVPLLVVESAKILGVHIASDLKWDAQVSEMLKKANGRLYMLKLLKHFNLPRDILSLSFLPLLDRRQSMPLLYGTLVSSPKKVPPWKESRKELAGSSWV